MTQIRHVFLDDGGVMNDNERRAPEWRRLIGEFFAPRLGGQPAAWARANVGAFERSWARFLAARDAPGGPTNEAFIHSDATVWLADMCEQVGVAAPAHGAADLAREGQLWISERSDSAYPDAVPAIRALAASGLRLYTASGGLSTDIDAYLRGMKVRDLFVRLYGPDLVRTWKNGPEFYRRILAHARVKPREALVVDDLPAAVEWAREAGMTALHLDRNGTGDVRDLQEVADRLGSA